MITSATPATAAAKFMPTASDCGSCASSPSIGAVAFTSPGAQPSAAISGEGSSGVFAQTSFRVTPASGIEN